MSLMDESEDDFDEYLDDDDVEYEREIEGTDQTKDLDIGQTVQIGPVVTMISQSTT